MNMHPPTFQTPSSTNLHFQSFSLSLPHAHRPPFPYPDLLSPSAAPVQASPLPPKKLHNPSWRPTSLLGHRHHSATRYSATNGILQASAANFTTLQDTVIRFPTETCCMEPYPTICTQATHMVPELSWHHPALPYTLAHASAHRTYAPAASNHPRPVA